MKKLATYTMSFLAYSVPVVRQATIYSETEPDRFGNTFEVSCHNGAPGVMWEFHPFATLEDATLFTLRFLAGSKLTENL